MQRECEHDFISNIIVVVHLVSVFENIIFINPPLIFLTY